MKEIFAPSTVLTPHRTSLFIAARNGTEEIRDDSEEDEPPSRRLPGGYERFVARSKGGSLLVTILVLFSIITGACATSGHDKPSRLGETALSMTSSNAADAADFTVPAVAVDRAEVESCNYECCASLKNNWNIVDEGNLRGITKRILQTTTAEAAPCPSPETESSMNIPPGLQYTCIVVLLLLSATFSGLTLGLMSLDLSGLEIVMATEDASLARAARAIYPVRKNGNLLLCTLLLGNVAVNSLLSILMADITSGLVGFLVSTFAIVIFGEIIPQAICSRFPLQVGEKAVPIVKVFILLLAVVAWPLAFVLNKVLGREIGTTYSSAEMTKLIELHVRGGHFDHETGAAMTGALRYQSMSVRDAMTPLHNTFMLSSDERLGFDTVAKIFKTGYSRIPVYEVTKSNVIGLLFVKDLIFLDPEDEIPVKNFVQIFGRGLHIVWPEDNLGHVLKMLKKGRSHMALVRDVNHGDGTHDPFYEIKGIITLEDIIEIILGDEIIDETDELIEVNDPTSHPERSDFGEFVGGVLEDEESEAESNEGEVRDNYKAKQHVHKRKMSSMKPIDWEARLRLLDERLVDEHLTPDEVRAVAAHLKTNYSKAMELISDKQLKSFLASVPVTDMSPAKTCVSEEGDDDECNWVPTDHTELLYERGVPADFCTVVLTGKLTVMSGADKFRSDVSNWGVLGTKALTDPSYVPDFSAWVVPTPHDSNGCKCIKLDRNSFFQAMDNTALEKTGHATIDSSNATPVMTTQQPHNADSKHSSPPPSPGRTIGVSDMMEPDMPPDTANAFHPTYVKSEEQKVVHKRRSKLLNAFMQVKKQESKNDLGTSV